MSSSHAKTAKKKAKKPSWLDKLTDKVVGPARPGVRAKAGPVRENIEAFSVAIMGAVFLKFFAIEAFAIPTSSMQPTLMGSEEAGVHDRLLVDKTRYTFGDPQRWDVAVFRYPLQKNQNYVKRVVGLPGERITVGGGNVFLCAEDGSIDEVLRRPDGLQEYLWKEVYPLRREVAGSASGGVDKWWRGQPSRSWKTDGETLVLTPTGKLDTLRFQVPGGGDLDNDVADGYPVEVSKDIKSKTAYQPHTAAAQDVRLSATIRASDTPQLLALELSLRPSEGEGQEARLEIREGKGYLLIRQGGKEIGGTPEGFSLELAAGTATELSLARCDDRLIAWKDGEIVGDLDFGKAHPNLRITSGLAKLEGKTPSSGASVLITGGGEVRVDDLRIERDIHYYLLDEGPMGHIMGPGGSFLIPPDHYFMMGDNTLQSVDSRGWQAITVGVLADGRMVDPNGPNGADAEKVRGNLRARDPNGEVDRDENPIVVPKNNTVSFIDEFGEIRAFRSGIADSYRADNVRFIELDEGGNPIEGSEWSPEPEFVPVVPKRHIIGRALCGFWPFWPFGPNRVGFIR